MAHASLDTFGTKQHGLVTRAQALTVLSRRQVEAQTAAGRLVVVRRAVYRVAGSPETWHQHLLAACLAGGRGTYASFRAAALWVTGRLRTAVLEARQTAVHLGESEPVLRIATLLVGAGLPPPVHQHRVRVEGRTRRLDLAYPELMIAIEYDGWAYHSQRSAFDADRPASECRLNTDTVSKRHPLAGGSRGARQGLAGGCRGIWCVSRCSPCPRARGARRRGRCRGRRGTRRRGAAPWSSPGSRDGRTPRCRPGAPRARPSDAPPSRR
jgi:hypothetical protein